MIIKNNIDCSWVGLARVNEIEEELVMLMKDAGCSSVEVGIESINENTLQNMKKGINESTIIKACNILKKHKVFLEGSFLVGFPGDTTESINKTIEFAKSLKLDYYRWHNFQASSCFLKMTNL